MLFLLALAAIYRGRDWRDVLSGGHRVHRGPLGHARARGHRRGPAADAADRVPDPGDDRGDGLENIAGAPSASARRSGAATGRCSPASSGWCTARDSRTTCRACSSARSRSRCSASISASSWGSWRSWRGRAVALAGVDLCARPSACRRRRRCSARSGVGCWQSPRWRSSGAVVGRGPALDGPRCWRSLAGVPHPMPHLGPRNGGAGGLGAASTIRVFADDLGRGTRRGPDRLYARASAFALADRAGRAGSAGVGGPEPVGDVSRRPTAGLVPGGLAGARVTSLVLLTERFADQVNVVRAAYAGRRHDAALHSGETGPSAPMTVTRASGCLWTLHGACRLLEETYAATSEPATVLPPLR